MARNITDYFKTDIRQSIVNDIRDIARYHARPRKKVEAGFFSVPRQVFCYIDFLGYLALGERNTKNAVSFIRDYFSDQYRDYAVLIYSMWRHGTVHEYKLRVFYAEFRNQSPKKVQVAWLSNNDDKRVERSLYLQFLPRAGKRSEINLCVNICQVVDDLLAALDRFIDKLTSNRNLKIDCQNRLNKVLSPRPYTSIDGKHWQEMVYEEIRLAWKNRSSTKIDTYGNTIKEK